MANVHQTSARRTAPTAAAGADRISTVTSPSIAEKKEGIDTGRQAIVGGRTVDVVDSGVIREAIAPERLGRATITPAGVFEAGTYASFTLTYTAGVPVLDRKSVV